MPLLTLIPQNALIMDKVEIEFQAKPENVMEGTQTSHLQNSEMSYELMELNMDSAICKVIDECNNTF